MQLFTKNTLVHTTEQHQNWRIAAQVLQSIQSKYMLDEAVETNSRYAIEKPLPWIGIFHTPPDAHKYSPFSMEKFIEGPYWTACEPTLHLAFALSEHSAKYLRELLKAPVITLYHPAAFVKLKFDPELYVRDANKNIHQLGWVFRNTQAIYQIPAIKYHTKSITKPKSSGAIRNVNHSIDFWKDGSRPTLDQNVREIEVLNDGAYDRLIASSIIFMEVFDASANNAVLDCIARNTPLVCNRHPALEEYLGKDYPLFYEDIREAASLFQIEKLLEGHHYLEDMDKEKFTGMYFRICIERALINHP